MAPVGRWQKNKDLGWYTKGDSSKAAVDAANVRAEEIRRIKEAEQDALSEALGFKVEPRLRDHQVAGPKEVEKAIKEAAEGEEEGGKGVGFGVYAGGITGGEEIGERLVGHMGEKGGLEGGDLKREKKRRRSRSPEKLRERQRREGHIEDIIESDRASTIAGIVTRGLEATRGVGLLTIMKILFDVRGSGQILPKPHGRVRGREIETLQCHSATWRIPEIDSRRSHPADGRGPEKGTLNPLVAGRVRQQGIMTASAGDDIFKIQKTKLDTHNSFHHSTFFHLKSAFASILI
ncbi:hypothetical protein MMC07_001941 [Pseudocyphellaria aurata]|nr:hypothetical protein [Pseudocyphellaria aurata]